MPPVQQAIRRYGPPPGAPGIEVIERMGKTQMADARYGTTAFYGTVPRGPEDVAVPINSSRQFHEIFGDPKDPNYVLDPTGAQQLADALIGFFATSGGAGQAWVTRIGLGGRAASIIIKNRLGGNALRVTAANSGRWGGIANEVPWTPIVAATARTMTIVAPGTKANEFIGAEAEVTSVTGKRYRIISNTEADPTTGEAVFVVSAQYNLISDTVSGPTAIVGTAAYSRYPDIRGTITFPLFANLTGTANVNGMVVTGTGTLFNQELKVGGTLYYGGEARVIESITSDTTLTIRERFSIDGAGVTLQRDNLVVTGTATFFTPDLKPGIQLYATINGERQGRTIRSIESATSLTLESGFTAAVTGVIASIDGLIVTGTGTAFNTDVQPGQFIVDPNRQGFSIRVVQVTSATELVVEQPFSRNFSAARITKQNQRVRVFLTPSSLLEGLTVEIGQGTRFPATHFSFTVNFNGSRVINIPDASLDPTDSLFIEPLVNESNVAHRLASRIYPKWVSVENLWTSAYTTGEGSDVRPCNGAGQVLFVTANRVYTVAPLDYVRAVGQEIYPSPYKQPRGYFRIIAASESRELDGTVSSTGTMVTGTATNFRSSLKIGDYLYDPGTKTVRRIRTILSDTSLMLDTVFPKDMPALTKATRSGFLEVSQGYDLTRVTEIGTTFLVVYPSQLTKGYNGDVANILPYQYTKFFDIDRNHLENAVWGKNVGLVRVAIPNYPDPTVQRAAAAYCEAKAFEFRGEIPRNYLTASEAEYYINSVVGRGDFQVYAFPSYGYISNPLGAGDRLITLSGDIMGGESKFAVRHEGYHVPFSGVHATMPRILRLPVDVMPPDEAILNLAGIQTMKMYYGNAVPWSVRSPAISTVRDFTHIGRIQNHYVRLFLEARTLMEILFLPNQPLLAQQVILTLNNFARREYKKGVFSNHLSFAQAVEIENLDEGGEQAVVSDESGRDAIVAIVNGKLHIYFNFIPTGVLEQFSIYCSPDILVAQYGNTLAQGY